MNKENFRNKSFYALIYLYLFYYFYRYIFQYNSSMTSPTYSDTPLSFQLAKYIILVLIICYFIIHNGLILHVSEKNKRIAWYIIFLSIMSLLYGILTTSVDLIGFSFELLPILFFMSNDNSIELEKVEKIINFFWFVSFAYDLIQLALYFAIGRLPALGYPTGKIIDVRFGATWDDPNGFAMCTVFFFFYHLMKYKRKKRLIFIGIDLFMLLLTWSATGAACIFLSILFISIMRNGDKKLIKNIFLFAITILIIGFIALTFSYSKLTDSLNYYLARKAGSLAGHKAGWDLSGTSLMTYLGIYPCDIGGEVGYLRLLTVGGIPLLFVFLMLEITAIKKAGKAIKNAALEQKPLLYGSLGYLFTFMLTLLNLPEQYNFSCLGMYTVCIILVCRYTKSSKE